MGGLSNPGVLAIVDETEVFNGSSPTVWTDLDLSSVVGSNYALVFLKLKNVVAATTYFSFRKNGETEVSKGDMPGVSTIKVIEATSWYVWTFTDITGKIEWLANAARAGTIIDIVAYLK